MLGTNPGCFKNLEAAKLAGKAYANDEYMFIVIDLATMLTDVSGEDSYAVEDAVNQLHKLVRKYVEVK